MSYRTILVSACAALAAAAPLAGQSTEIGVSSGLSVFTAEGADALTVFSTPGSGSLLPTSSFYVTAFPSPNVSIEPQIGLLVAASGGATDWMGSFGAQIAYHSRGGADSSPYFGGNASWVRDLAEDNNFTLGAVVGYRWIVPPGLGLRVEAGYKRWFTGGEDGFDPPDLNQFGLTIGIGGLVGG
ncbi:MAG: hypothetical protein ABFS34_06410 [Gemmatimonadota bacterium]